MYNDSIVKIAKRDNNNKRKYLVVNEKQGKHIPVSPNEAFFMFNTLAGILKDEYKDEKLLLIGFAETATAIGASVSITLGSYYMQTTRENIEGVMYLYFSESHSHATEQKLVKDDLDKIIDKVDRVIFIEDEVTTGNTIMSIVRLIESTYNYEISFSVASLLNGMDNEARKRFDESNIKLHYLVKINHSNYTKIAESYACDGIYIEAMPDNNGVKYNEICLSGCINARRLHKADDYHLACKKLSEEVVAQIKPKNNGSYLIIGTEEFMYPALELAMYFRGEGRSALCHSTTRSPIEVSSENDYPLHRRFELVSMYEDGRRTFIYDLDKYDEVIIVTDAPNPTDAGLNSLLNALNYCGNQNITLVRWL